ncbi:MAG: GNAT family N-acetyltransferase [Nitrospirae bacterium]|nr:GNAT family N-acetyltransferase [Candidatus Manganitrophaceae bacterium]
MDYQVEEISDFDRFTTLEKEWNALLAAAPINAPFLRHEWFRIWWKAFGEGKRRMAILTVRAQGGALVAIAPLMEERGFRVGIPCRIWTSLCNDHSCRFDFILADLSEEARAGIFKALTDYLSARRPRIHFLELQDLPADSPTLTHLTAASGRGGRRLGMRPSLETPILPMQGKWSSYFESVSGNLRRNLRRRRRQLEEQGKVALVCVTGDSRDGGTAGLIPHLEEGFRIEAMAWKGAAGTAIDGNGGWSEFYSEWAHTAAERGWLRLYFLKLDDRPIAFYYTLVYDQKLYYLKLGYDPAYARYSPGILLHQEILSAAFQEGLTELDFLGPRMAWKEDWTAQLRPHLWLYLFEGGMIPRAIYLIKFKLFPYLREISWLTRLQRRLLRKDAFGVSAKPATEPLPEAPFERTAEAVGKEAA